MPAPPVFGHPPARTSGPGRGGGEPARRRGREARRGHETLSRTSPRCRESRGGIDAPGPKRARRPANGSILYARAGGRRTRRRAPGRRAAGTVRTQRAAGAVRGDQVGGHPPAAGRAHGGAVAGRPRARRHGRARHSRPVAVLSAPVWRSAGADPRGIHVGGHGRVPGPRQAGGGGHHGLAERRRGGPKSPARRGRARPRRVLVLCSAVLPGDRAADAAAAAHVCAAGPADDRIPGPHAPGSAAQTPRGRRDLRGVMIAVLCGGVGGVKLVAGLAAVLPDPTRLSVIVNTADDWTWCGLHVSPDVDTVLYTLAGCASLERGWESMGTRGTPSRCSAATGCRRGFASATGTSPPTSPGRRGCARDNVSRTSSSGSAGCW